MVRARLPLALALALAVGVAIGLGACADEPRSQEVGTVVYGVSGGIAGVSEKLRVEASGDATYVEGGGGQAERVAFSLAADELADLRRVLADHPLDELPEVPSETECADCFYYSVSYGGEDYGGDDTTLPDEADPVFSALRVVLDTHVPSRLADP